MKKILFVLFALLVTCGFAAATVPDFDAAGDGSIFEPSVAYGLALDAGDLAFVLGFPIGYHPEITFGAYATAGFVFPF